MNLCPVQCQYLVIHTFLEGDRSPRSGISMLRAADRNGKRWRRQRGLKQVGEKGCRVIIDNGENRWEWRSPSALHGGGVGPWITNKLTAGICGWDVGRGVRQR